MAQAIERLVQEAFTGSKDIITSIGDQELEFEIWFNFIVSRIGVANLINACEIYDDLTFNMDGYKPSTMPVVNNYIKDMKSIGIDFIKPSYLTTVEQMINDDGDTPVEELNNFYWVLFTVVENNHPLKGVRYATAIHDGELCYPPFDPTFTDSYPDEHVHPSAMGIFIDNRERFIKKVRPELYKVDVKGILLK